jgi:hypothetical protein
VQATNAAVKTLEPTGETKVRVTLLIPFILTSLPRETVSQSLQNLIIVMLSKAKHLAFSPSSDLSSRSSKTQR